MKRIHLLVGVLLLVGCTLLPGCYPGGADVIGELDLVAVQYDQNYDFNQARTYFLPDSVVHIPDQYGQNQVNPAFDPYILQEIARQLDSRGFTRLTDTTQRADVVVLTSVTGNTNVNVYSSAYYDYWDWYGGWGAYGIGPGYGYGYPGYYSPVTVSAYQTGSLIIQMVDPNRRGSTNQTIPTVWIASFNGLLEGSQASILERMRLAVGQAFNQSPYLLKSGQ